MIRSLRSSRTRARAHRAAARASRAWTSSWSVVTVAGAYATVGTFRQGARASRDRLLRASSLSDFCRDKPGSTFGLYSGLTSAASPTPSSESPRRCAMLLLDGTSDVRVVCCPVVAVSHTTRQGAADGRGRREGAEV